MLMKDAPAYGLYFMLFENNKRWLGVSDQDRILYNYHGLSENQIGLRKGLSGGIAGTIAWTLVYPADTIKINLQTAANRNGISVSKLTRTLLQEHGMLYFYRGLHVMLMRTLPATCTSMYCFETMKSHLHGHR